MTGSIQQWPTPGRGVGLSASRTISRPLSLQAVLAQEERELTDIKRYHAALTVENKALAKNFVKIAIIEKCIEENEKTREFFRTVIHLLTIAEKAYEAMGLPWSKMITLSDGPIDIFSETFIDTKIRPFLSELETIESVGFTEFPELEQDKGIQDMKNYAIEQREKAIEKADETKQCCTQFLEHRTSLNKTFALGAYLQLRRNLSGLLSGLLTILTDVYAVTESLFRQNNHYAKRSLPDFKEKIKASKIDEKLKRNCERLEQSDKEIAIHENSIQLLKVLIRGEPLSYSLIFLPPPKPALKEGPISDDLEAEKSIPNPQKWTRVKFG